MREFEVYLPMTTNDGAPVDAAAIQRIKETLMRAFGGYTHLDQRFQGAWSMGGVTFREDVTILRVLDDGTARFDMYAFKAKIESALNQQKVLIVERAVNVV
jgi:hypothetical protein